MKQTRIAIAALTTEQQKKAQETAAILQLPFIVNTAEANLEKTYDFLLLFTPDFIGLQNLHHKKNIFHIDFLSGKMRHRSKLASLHSELLAKALGQKPKDHPVIIDATAGLGRDSFILAALGFHLTMLEKSPIIHLLLQDGLERASHDEVAAPIIHKLQLIPANAVDWLPSTHPKPDIIYLDPMFPERKKSALVKKEMLVLQDVLTEDLDSDQLLTTALTCATRRVVVKRPRLAPNLANLQPHFSIKGKSSRFDVYLISKK
ncbi:MAG: class I SAM-dependent methyltransferase [Gammaproteobacteria bacterium]|nr:class I SAM-dependent methyltransferase [Gammaproteobacteria bacterium]